MFKTYTNEQIDATSIYRKTDDCVFPYHCDCNGCEYPRWGAKSLSVKVDEEVIKYILKNQKCLY